MTIARQSADPVSVRKEIAKLQSLKLEALRTIWRSKFKRDGDGLSRDILLRMLIWRIQEQAFGGYDHSTGIALKRYSGNDGNLGDGGNSRHVQIGSVLVREYQGARHTVTVVPNGFEWREQIYSNLSRIAREITGVKWNGPRFFGLRQMKNTDADGRGGRA